MNKRDYDINPKLPTDKDLERFKDFDKVVDKVNAAAPQNSLLKVVKSKWLLGVSAGLVVAAAAAFYWQQSSTGNTGNEVAEVEKTEQQVHQEIQALVAPAATPDDEKQRITPPIPKWDVPYEVFDIDADKGADLVSKNGSGIHIGPQSFVDEKGNAVHGMINIRYREFHDPLGIFLSGIPMEYDTAGKACTFESAGMFEMLAEKAGSDLQLRSGKAINIDLVSLTREEQFNVYYFDSIAGEWKYKAESTTKAYTDLTNEVNDAKEAKVDYDIAKVSPPAFREQKKDKYSFSAKIDLNKFPELNKDVIFEVDDSIAAFDPLLYDVRWDDVTLNRSKYKGHYALNLKKGSKEVAVEAVPVFSTEKYKEVIDLYNKGKAEFENNKSAKKEFSFSYIAPETSPVQKEIAQLLRIGTEQKQVNAERINFRPVVMVALGLWNCDRARTFTETFPIAASVTPSFKGKADEQLQPEKIYNVAGKKNSLYSNDSHGPVYYSKKDNNTMWVLLPDETIGIASPDDFKKIKGDTHDFKMDIYSSVDGLKKLRTVMKQ